MKQSASVKVFILLSFLATITVMLTFVQVASAGDIQLAASPPAVIYYTTSGADATVNGADASGTLSKELNKELKKHFSNTYKLNKRVLSFRLKHTPYGPSGTIDFTGQIIPKNTPFFQEPANTIAERMNRARLIAKAFIDEEANSFGITDNNEIREAEIFQSSEGTHIHLIYQQFPLTPATAQIHWVS